MKKIEGRFQLAIASHPRTKVTGFLGFYFVTLRVEMFYCESETCAGRETSTAYVNNR